VSLLAETRFFIETYSTLVDIEDIATTIVARARNDPVDRLIEPFDDTRSAGRLLVVRGREAYISGFREQLSCLVKPALGEVMYLNDLSGTELERVLSEGFQPHVLGLMECGTNLWTEDITDETFENIKSVLSSATSVLWLLQGSQASITHGLFTTLYYELPETRSQTLDIGQDLHEVSARLVAECMLQLYDLSEMAQRGESDQVLWSIEPELYVDDSRLYVARLRAWVEGTSFMLFALTGA
jgi:hypothetical protein